ncbi:MAG: hypothetical protein A2166_03960 [Omnitrophica WOR_2 bacterium RBG_13_41_10]|nr:MAG: hypothetical protein A2166_03960 [Omnitrophica WOR_2 bacterium RBG_13_41_10]
MEKKLNKDYVCIYRTPSHDQLAIIKSLLDSNEIPYFIENEHFASLIGVSDGAVNFGIMIKTSYSEEAKELLNEIIQPKDK